MHDLAGRGWTLAGVTSDTALAAYLVRPGQRSFALDDLSLRYLRRELRADNPEQQQLSLLDDDEGVDDQAVQTLILRARAVVDLADALDEELARIDSSSLLGEMELPVQTVLAGMETVGIAVDLDMLTELQSTFGNEIRDAAEAAYAVIGKQINLGSPKQLQVVLFDELEMPKTKTHQDRLHHRRRRAAVAVRQDRAPVPAAPAGPPRRHPAQGHRRRPAEVGGLPTAGSTPRSTRPSRPPAGSRRPSRTCRTSRSAPTRAAQIRDAFVVGDGYAELMTADYSQIEMRIMAHLSRDEGLIEAFNTGEDLHSFVASRAFGVPIDEVTRRTAAPGQGDVLRPGLRAERLRPGRTAEDLHRGGQGPDGPVLRPVRRGARLPAVRRRPGPQGRLHLDGAGPSALPARAGQQQPQGPRGRRARRAQRPDPGQRRRHHQGRDDRRRQGAARRRS